MDSPHLLLPFPLGPPPTRALSLAECFTEGHLNVRKWTQRNVSLSAMARWRTSFALQSFGGINGGAETGIDEEDRPKKRRAQRGVYRYKGNKDDPVEIIPPEESTWYKMYVTNLLMLEDDPMCQKFRERFRLPYNEFLKLVKEISADERFDRWCGTKVNNKKASPVELLVMGSLRYLGRGWTMDDLEEQTNISSEVHRVFFLVFIEFGSTTFYKKHVNTPIKVEEATTHMREFAEAGFPGCIGSIDCTQITTEGCSANLKNNHLGLKSSNTTRTFNLTVNHRHRILHSTRGGPGRWNDQTMVRFDEFISGIRDGTVLEDMEFELFELDKDGNPVTVKYNGVYVICDNGYLRWSCTVPPFSVANERDQLRWSAWVESMRKDVECTFGILKGRWRILKAGVRIHGVEQVDQIWLTCCALHNWLLDIDGLSEEWKEGVPVISDWEGPLADMDYEGVAQENYAHTIARLSANLDPRNYDSSGMGPGQDVVNEGCINDDEYIPDGLIRTVDVEMSLPYFRKRLVEHFDILWKRNEIRWPTRRRANHRPLTNV